MILLRPEGKSVSPTPLIHPNCALASSMELNELVFSAAPGPVESVMEGSRSEAARNAGMDRRTSRDWVRRYNAEEVGSLGQRKKPARSVRIANAPGPPAALPPEVHARDFDGQLAAKSCGQGFRTL